MRNPNKSMPERVEVDVCLILEGTYPYIQGGVSAWVHQIIQEMPDIIFGLFFIGTAKESYSKPIYELPENVVNFTEAFLFDPITDLEQTPNTLSRKFSEPFYRNLQDFYFSENDSDRFHTFNAFIDYLDKHQEKVTFGNFCQDIPAWDLLVSFYEKHASEESFIDFFWSVRFMHMPLWSLLKSRQLIPPARMYHSVSTGYAGLIGSIASRKHHCPYLLSEHGIYTKERIAEISQANWIYEAEPNYFDEEFGVSIFKQMWINLFSFFGKYTYHSADRIIALYDDNNKLQLDHGASMEKLDVIPNGIYPSQFDLAFETRRKRREEAPTSLVVGFFGRIVPIKDVKTLIRAANHVILKFPETVFLLAGPTDEDKDYFNECQEMVDIFGIKDSVQFIGRQQIHEFLPRIDVLLSTSISEGLPMVILEAFACGIPVVTSDVGACRELIFGRIPEDRQAGKAGLLTKIASPEDTSESLISLITSPQIIDQMGQVARKRVERFYKQNAIIGQYYDLY